MDILNLLIIAGKFYNISHVIIIFIMLIDGMCWMNNEVRNHQIFFCKRLYVHYLLQILGTQYLPK